MKEGDWMDRKFYAIDICEQGLDEVAEMFQELLSQENIRSKKSIEYAKKLVESEVKKKVIEKNLPATWNKIISEPHPSLLSLLSETTETMCGHRPSDDETRNFLKSYIDNLLLPQKIKIPPTTKISDPNNNHRKPLFFRQITPHRKTLIIANILNRKELWTQFIQKRVLTTDAFKELSHFKPMAVSGFTKFLTGNQLATGSGKTYTIKEDIVSTIRELLDRGIEEDTTPLRDFESIPRDQIQRHLLDRAKLWEVFLERRKMTGPEFKKFSKFKPKSISAFFHFLTANGIAKQTGDIFELVPSAIDSIKRLISSRI